MSLSIPEPAKDEVNNIQVEITASARQDNTPEQEADHLFNNKGLLQLAAERGIAAMQAVEAYPDDYLMNVATKALLRCEIK